MVEREAFEEWWGPEQPISASEAIRKRTARAAFEAGARSRDAEVERLNQVIDERNEHTFVDERNAALRVSARLRETLRELCDALDDDLPGYAETEPIEAARKRARAALGEKGGDG